MQVRAAKTLFVVSVLLNSTMLSLVFAAEKKPVDFTNDIRPILTQHCLSCHGPDEPGRKGKLRLDLREKAVAKEAIIPGDVKASEMIVRIDSKDETEQMPPPEIKKPLNEKQKQLLRDWIEQGAKYDQHWAFQAPQRQPLPAVQNTYWPQNFIDHFILARLEKEKISPSPEADRPTLLRRVSLDLTGVPPTVEELSSFLEDKSPDAYEKVVDRLLASPRYGERTALGWLDSARYADTNGYNNDEDRTMWPWRDWVIDAFNRNMPYDQFIIEQLAGDMLPNSTSQQQIASGFNRNLGHNTEGGIIQEEYRVEYVADRVHTTATILLGLSMQCARCHDHKFDPISQKEYYQFFGFFNAMDEKQASYSKFLAAEPYIKVPSSEQQAQLNALAAKRQKLEEQIKQRETGIDADVAKWEREQPLATLKKVDVPDQLLRFKLDEKEGDAVHDSVDPARSGKAQGKPVWTSGKLGGALQFDGQTFVDLGPLAAFDGKEPFSISAWVRPESKDPIAILSKMDESESYRGYDVLIEGGKVCCHLVHHWPDNAVKVTSKKALSLSAWQHVAITYDGSRSAAGLKIYLDGKLESHDVNSDTLKDTIATEKPLHLGRRQTSLSFKGALDDLQIFRRSLNANDAAQLAGDQSAETVRDILKVTSDGRSLEQRVQLRKYYLEHVDQEFPRLKAALADFIREQSELEKSLPAVMVMKEMPTPRDTFVLKRGAYDQHGEKVTPGVPAFLPAMAADAPRNRLGLARWLMDPANPLTARVAVNRWWQQMFGTGLVRTVEDFGVTGESPTHPQLLDHLATELVRNGWDIKALHKLMALSATYRQSSKLTRELEARDPENKLLARSSRYRLPAEVVRDNALAISGLLVERLGGPSVKPYQPAGLWEDVSVERRAKYVEDKGEGLYRRSLYTFWKRTCPPPALTTFDAPNREVCLARRARTNTPLQALVLLNDPTYVEAARKFAERVLAVEAPAAERIHRAIRLALSKTPSAEEQQILLDILNGARERFRGAPAEAAKLLKVGQSPHNEALDSVELAAWTVVCSTILNLDETISKR